MPPSPGEQRAQTSSQASVWAQAPGALASAFPSPCGNGLRAGAYLEFQILFKQVPHIPDLSFPACSVPSPCKCDRSRVFDGR